MACDVSTVSTVFISLTLVESVLMVLLSIFYILMYNCNVEGFEDLHNYIQDYSCDNQSTAADSLIFSPQTFYHLQIYSICLYIIWFAICIVILSQRCCCKTRLFPSHILWLVTCVASLLTDLSIGTIVTLDYVEDDPEGPALAVVLFSFKGGVGIVLNIVAMIVVCMTVVKTKKDKKKQHRKEVNAGPSRGTSEMKEIRPESRNLPPPILLPPGGQRRDSLPTREVVEEIEWNQKMRAANAQRSYIAEPNNSRQYSGPVPYREPVQLPYGVPYDDRRVSPDDSAQSPYGASYDDRNGTPYDDRRGRPTYRQPSKTSYDYNRNPYAGDISEQPLYNNQKWSVKNEPPHRRTNFRPIPTPAYEEDNIYEGDEQTTNKNNQQSESSDSDDRNAVASTNQPPLSKEEEPVKPAMSKQFDLRPFSYINPTFRPSDHMDVKAMEEHPVDTFKVLVQEVKQLREKQRERRDSLATSVENDSRSQSPIQSKSEDKVTRQITAV